MTEEPQSIDPSQFKHLLNGKNNKPQHHAKYDYYQQESFETELNEFISYSEVKTELREYEVQYKNTFAPWKESSIQEKRNIIQSAIDRLDFINDEKRISTAKCLAFISLGNYTEYMGKEEKELHFKTMKENNQLLFQYDILSLSKQALNHGCNQLETLSINSNLETEIIESFCKEIDIYLSILFITVEFNKQDSSIQEYRLGEFLFDLVVRLKEHFTKTFPLKKLMLTLYKVLKLTLGELDTEEYIELKSNIRSVCNLPIIQQKDKFTTIKCTPEDLYNFYHQTTSRYPTFTPNKNKNNDKIANPLTITASTRLIHAMGLFNASKDMDLPYQTLFPSKNQQSQQQQQQQQQHMMKKQEINTNILPFTENSSIEPYSITEANSVWLNHLYISIANYQIIYEREKTVNRWQRWKNEKNRKDEQQEQEDEKDEWQNIIYKHLSKKESRKMNEIEQLYASIVPHFQSIVVVVLKLLLSTVSIGKDKEAEIVEDVNITRNRETISKAVSGILLLLLKWFKTCHVLKFEYLSQILIDSGCMLLVLKLLGLQEVALLASKRTDNDSQSFFGYVQQQDIKDETMEEEEEEKEELYTNKRNLFWSINLLRILQMLTKKKTHRILLLVQYKSSAILKRLLKVGHPVMDLYVLKNLKNQVPFMGRKWRSSNMKTISAIYSHCLTSLNDDWLSSPEGNGDMEEGAMKEINLRMLIRLYNGSRYLSNILPKMDEMSGSETKSFYIKYETTTTTTLLPNYDLDTSTILIENIELDDDFKNNYNNWLETNVYNTEDEEDEEELNSNSSSDSSSSGDGSDENENMIGTPLPDIIPKPITADDLTREINKLYLEELQREFEIKQEKQRQLKLEKANQSDGWDTPIIQSKNSWGNMSAFIALGTSSTTTTTDTSTTTTTTAYDDDEEEGDEIEPEVDPLQGIDWNSLTEQDLKHRLTLVEEKTVHRWLNIDMDDPAYIKVLNTFEGEILQDDEGWPI